MLARLERVTYPNDQIYYELANGVATRADDAEHFDVGGTWGVLEDYQVVGVVRLENRVHILYGGKYFPIKECELRDDLDRFWLGLLAALRLRKGRLELTVTLDDGAKTVLGDSALHQRFDFFDDDHSHIFHQIDFDMNGKRRLQERLAALKKKGG